MAFWKMNNANPKRKFRFRIVVTHPDWSGPELWYAKSCTAPSVEVSSVEHMFSDHVFNFPGRAKWNDIEMVLVDPAGSQAAFGSDTAAAEEPNTVSNFNKVLVAFGYDIPADGSTDASYQTIARNKIQDCVINIQALDDDGKAIEVWTLYNSFPISFKYGDFDYGADDLREMNITWKYDYATANVDGVDQDFGHSSAGT